MGCCCCKCCREYCGCKSCKENNNSSQEKVAFTNNPEINIEINGAATDESSAPTQGTLYVALYDYDARVEEDLTFKQSEKLVVTNTDDRDWWYAYSSLSNSAGYVPSNYVAPDNSYEAEGWYFGDTKRMEAEKKLMDRTISTGIFLVRKAETIAGDFSLSVRVGESVKHYKIRNNQLGYFINQTSYFMELKDLVEHYRRSDDGLVCALRAPCPPKKPATAGLARDIWEIPRESLNLKRRVGSGKYGEVWEGLWNDTQVAVKTLKEGSMSIESFLEEANIMKNIRHRHLVKLYAICSDREPIYIVTEFVSKGCLLEYLKGEEGAMLLPTHLIDMLRQVAAGMEYLEIRGYVHRDLAARNILVEENNQCKIADFGLSRLLQENDYYAAHDGADFPIKWTAIESALYGKYTVKSDAWSFGILMTEVITKGRVPYPGMTNQETIEAVSTGYRMPIPSGFPEVLYQIVEKCWHETPDERPNFKQIQVWLEHELGKTVYQDLN